jgi:hypothetical protein
VPPRSVHSAGVAEKAARKGATDPVYRRVVQAGASKKFETVGSRYQDGRECPRTSSSGQVSFGYRPLNRLGVDVLERATRRAGERNDVGILRRKLGGRVCEKAAARPQRWT